MSLTRSIFLTEGLGDRGRRAWETPSSKPNDEYEAGEVQLAGIVL
jgi:hypothetical protein